MRVSFTCPFCGAAAGASAHPEYAVIHQRPPCDTFTRLDATAYLAAVNAELRRTGKPEVGRLPS